MRISERFKIDPTSFWFYQITGWSMFYIADTFLIFFVRNRNYLGFLEETLQDIALMLLSLGLRAYYRRIKFQRLSVVSILATILVCSVAATVVWYFFAMGFSAIFGNLRGFQSMLKLNSLFYWVGIISPIMFGWSTLYFGIKFWFSWSEQRDRAEEASTLAQRAQLQMLRHQLNPHFLFNALNSIRALMHEDTKNAKTMITELSEFLRYSLHDTDSIEVPLHSELNAIKHYLSIEKKRFDDKLEIGFDVKPEAEEFLILSFLVHPFIENAIKYGMKTSGMPLRILIKARLHAGSLFLSVSNSGSWYKNSEDERNNNSTGTGLENARARLENAYPGRYSLAISEDNGMVTMTLEIRKQTEESFNRRQTSA